MVSKVEATCGPDALVRDPRRLAAVKRTGLLDSPPEESFDRLTRLAARLLRAPVTFISLVDELSDFYKSHCGFPEPLATTRRIEGRTFCHYAIASREPLLIPDTLADPVYREVPTVKSLGVRAYAGVPLVDEGGQTIGSFCAIDFAPHPWSPQDVEILTELAHSAAREIRLRAALGDAQRHLGDAQEAKRVLEDTLAVVAHDLRTPLNVMSLSLNVLEPQATDAQRTVLARMRRAAESSERLVEDLLQRSRFETGHLVLDPMPLPARQLLDDAAAMLRPLAGRHGVTLSTEAAPDLGTVRADYQLVMRAISNLVVNAVKFSPADSTVRMSAVRSGERVRYAVADDGPGIAVEDVQRLFDRFWQADNRDTRGLGLGLSITQAIVTAHGGMLGVESEIGKGSVFMFTLPLAADGPIEPSH